MIKKHTILVVDHEESFIEYIQRMMSDENYNLITVASGQEGLDVLEKQQVSMVISEYEIPLMNGLEFLEKVRIIYPNILTIKGHLAWSKRITKKAVYKIFDDIFVQSCFIQGQ